MGTVTDKPALTNTAPLEPLIVSASSLIDRSEQAQMIAEHILSSKTRIVVLYGKRGSGKTELIRRWVVPLVAGDYPVFRSDKFEPQLALTGKESQTIDFWEATTLRSIIFFDRFEDFFAQDPAFQVDFLKELANRIERKQVMAHLVLVMRREHLNRLFVMREALPQIVEEVYEIESISSDKAADALCQMLRNTGLRIQDGVSGRIDDGFQKLQTPEAGISAELVAVLALEICRLKDQARQSDFTPEDYESSGELFGILTSYLNSSLDHLSNDAKQLATAILEEVVLRSRVGRGPDFEELADRFDVPAQTVRQTIQYLEQERLLLRSLTSEQFEIIPLQLIRVIDDNIGRREENSQQAKTLLRQGIRIFLEQASLLTEQNFTTIHLQRSSLKTSEEEARLMLRSALTYEGDRTPGATRYWLRRVRQRPGKVEILLSALFDSQPMVRARAAGLLAEFNQPEVCSELYLLALRDPSDKVRAQAVESLARFKDDRLKEQLVREVRDTGSRYREAAIEALRIFPDEETTTVMLDVIAGPSPQRLRVAGIQTIAQFHTPEAMEALLQVALGDQEGEDRHAAAVALGATRGEGLIRNLLAKVPNRRDLAARARRSFLRYPLLIQIRNAILASITVIADCGAHGLILCILGRVKAGIPIMALAALGAALGIYGFREMDKYQELIWPIYVFWSGLILFLITGFVGELAAISILLREGKQKVTGSFKAFLNFTLFILNGLPIVGVFFWIQGMAHMLTKRFVRGAALFGFELMGVLLFFVAVPLKDSFPKLFWFYLVLGSVLFCVSYIYDVTRVLTDSVVFLGRRESRRRVESVYQEMLKNPEICLFVIRMLEGDQKGAHWAAKILTRFASILDPAPLIDSLSRGTRSTWHIVVRCLKKSKMNSVVTLLITRWKDADLSTKKRIAVILSGQATEESVSALRPLAAELGWSGRAQYIWSLWAFRFGVWPKSLLALLTLGLFVLSGLAFVGYKSRNELNDLAETVLSKTESIEKRITAGKSLALKDPERAMPCLKKVIDEEQDLSLRDGMLEALSSIAKRRSLQAWVAQGFLMEKLRNRDEDKELRKYVLNTLRDVAVGPDSHDTEGVLVYAIFEVLSDPQEDTALRHLALEDMEQVGTATACAKLREFTETGQTEVTRTGKPRPNTLSPPEEKLRQDAIRALGQIAGEEAFQTSGREPTKAFEALEVLTSEKTLSTALRDAAFREIDGLTPLARAQLDFDQQKYEDAINVARGVLTNRIYQARVPRANELMGLAYYRLALVQPSRLELWQSSVRHLEVASRLKSLDKEGNLAAGQGLYMMNEQEKARVYLHNAIALAPLESSAYSVLLYTYDATGQPEEAAADFSALGGKYPESIYPSLNLAFVYHESLAPKNPQFYAMAHDVYPALLLKKMPSANLALVKENFMEANLTTGRYQEASKIGDELLKDPSVAEDTEAKVNIRFLMLASAFFQGAPSRYRAHLDDLLSLYLSLPEGTEGTWTYVGTKNYINTSTLSREGKRFLISVMDLVEHNKSKIQFDKFCQEIAGVKEASSSAVQSACSN